VYGVRFAGTQDFAELASLGVMHPTPGVYTLSEIPGVINAARTIRQTYPNFKPNLLYYPGRFPFNCDYSSEGDAFVRYLNDQNYWDDILAINGIHEPLGGYWGPGNPDPSYCKSLDQIQNTIQQIKQASGGRAKIMEKMYSDVAYQGVNPVDGICDYCGVLYHPFRGSYLRDTLESDLERDLDLINSVSPDPSLEYHTDNKFVPWVCTIDWEPGFYMPLPVGPDGDIYTSEMYDVGNLLVSKVVGGYQIDGMLWYTWGNNGWTGIDDYFANIRPDLRDEMYQVLTEVGQLR
jgi:hypothetical protein